MNYFSFNRENTFCICKNVGRWNEMYIHFLKCGLDVTNIYTDTFKELFEPRSTYYLSKRSYLHTQILFNLFRDLVKKDIPYILVLEESAYIDSNFREKLERWFVGQFTDEFHTIVSSFLQPHEPIKPKYPPGIPYGIEDFKHNARNLNVLSRLPNHPALYGFSNLDDMKGSEEFTNLKKYYSAEYNNSWCGSYLCRPGPMEMWDVQRPGPLPAEFTMNGFIITKRGMELLLGMYDFWYNVYNFTKESHENNEYTK
jgi:hypothetical protein